MRIRVIGIEGKAIPGSLREADRASVVDAARGGRIGGHISAKPEPLVYVRGRLPQPRGGKRSIGRATVKEIVEIEVPKILVRWVRQHILADYGGSVEVSRECSP